MNELELKTKEWGKEILESIAEDWKHRQDTWQLELNNFEKYGRSFSLTSNTDFSRESPSKRSSKNFVMDSIMDGYISSLEDIRTISPRLLSNREVATLLVDLEPRTIMFLSPKLRCDPEICRAVIIGATSLIHDEAIYSVGPNARNDKELMTIWAEKFDNALEVASPRLKADKEFVKHCIEHSAYAISCVDDSLKNDLELALYAVEIHGVDALYYIENDILKNEEFINESSEYVPYMSVYDWKEEIRKQIFQNESRNSKR